MFFNKSLMGLRGFAAAVVFLFHIWSGAVKGNFLPNGVPEIINSAFLSLQFGVELFFMISGYLITHSIKRHRSVQRFMIDRVLRIYPPFIPVLILIFLLGIFSNYSYFEGVKKIDWIWLFIVNLLFIPGIYPMRPALLVAWTLSYEAAFYVFCSAVYVLGTRCSRALTISTSGALVVLAIYFYPRASFFLIGSMTYMLYPFILRFSEKIWNVPTLMLCVLFSCLLLVTGEIRWRTLSWIEYAILWFITAVSASAFFSCIVAEIGIFSRILRSTIFQQLGAISYSLYLWHTPVMFFTKRLSQTMLSGRSEWIIFSSFTISSILISLPISFLSYCLIEKWLREKFTARLYRNKTTSNKTMLATQSE